MFIIRPQGYVHVTGGEQRGEPEAVAGVVAQRVRHEGRAPPVPRRAALGRLLRRARGLRGRTAGHIIL